MTCHNRSNKMADNKQIQTKVEKIKRKKDSFKSSPVQSPPTDFHNRSQDFDKQETVSNDISKKPQKNKNTQKKEFIH